ncbi:MAG: ComF family protein [Clostridia bacterium]|nr:ComF family protein [Clostridia bacterium]
MTAPGLAGLWDLLYPPASRCTACDHKLAGAEKAPLCDVCDRELALIPAGDPCPSCGLPGAARGCLPCLRQIVRAMDTVCSAFDHSGPARKLVHALKYGKVFAAAPPLAEGMAEALWEQRDAFDLLVPVPLHRRKLRERGFNQAMVLAEALGELVGLPAREMLARVVDTAQQATLDADARLANMRGAFEPLRPMIGLRVLIIDDVRTTGATAEAVAMACRQGQAASVGLLTATRA